MLKFCIIFSALICFAFATLGHHLHPQPTADECEPTRRVLVEHLLHTEKTHLFAEKLATCRDCGLDSVRQVRWLPIFFDETGGTFANFFLLEGNFTANEAFKACQKIDGAQLASLHTPDRLEYVNKILVAGNYWFGLHRWPKCPYFIWSNGQMLGNSTTYWSSTSEPRAHGSGYDCVRAVTPSDMTCNGTFCYSSRYASWMTEKCDSTDDTFAALCETAYPRQLFHLIKGKFDRDSADAACKATFTGLMKPGLAKPRYLPEFNSLLYNVNRHLKNWNCWVGFERFRWNECWRHRWIDGSMATRFMNMPMLHNRNFTYWKDTQTCISLYDPDYSASLSYASQGFYDYNDCTDKLDCAICEWYLPLE